MRWIAKREILLGLTLCLVRPGLLGNPGLQEAISRGGRVMISEIVFRDGWRWALSAARGESTPAANAKVDD